jgi:hypothetical protein
MRLQAIENVSYFAQQADFIEGASH